MRHAVIMAGGAGTRLWPLSRSGRPKQLLKLFGGRSLLRESYERLAAMLPPESIYVITGEKHLDLVSKDIPELPKENLFGEPTGRDTSNAIGLAAAILHERDPDGCMSIFTADHIINPQEQFARSVGLAFDIVEKHPDHLITFGIRPSGPHTGYGYIHRGGAVQDGVYNVNQFTEKPNITEAMKYVASGAYYWNSGMFTWRIATILDQLKKHLPGSYAGLTECAKAWSTPQKDDVLKRIYPELMKISIDFAVMEKAENVLVVEMNCQWIDVGSWTALEQVVGGDVDGNVVVGAESINLVSRGNIIVSDDNHLFATIGVNDLVIVRSNDATLICTKRDAQGIKELVAMIENRYDQKYL